MNEGKDDGEQKLVKSHHGAVSTQSNTVFQACTANFSDVENTTPSRAPFQDVIQM